MSNNTLDLINAIAQGDAVGAEESFQASMSEKIGTHLDTMRQDVANTLFSTPVVEEGVDVDNDGIDDAEEADSNGDGKHNKKDHKAPAADDDPEQEEQEQVDQQ
jgi:hypothetical protein